ncbi:heavy metal translocating P-type ATPase [Comamonas sp. Y6]|uniref:P-type Zn(2+) transporter n=1 Tax=Comamonas resistens TaxID=3046670 RepID=A0ABY8SR28_9BURK|nr:heavy metal translocating P-type ATPase [Comamonas resistens]MDL5035808.1 heavy metal translocating P-type ATPase [Comamonas resistens]WHS65220.1 heavy metal translocating P-type ATPase [Comamonas resistens]HBP0978992.1 cadmium-translocating P-type ATPase [Pseudomonas aeruginosa]
MSSRPYEAASETNEQLVFQVEGMDCASCVGKIETALQRMAGISEVEVNFTAETLTLARSPASPTSGADVTNKIRSLGFDARELPGSHAPVKPAAHLRKSQDGHSAHDHAGCNGHEHTSHGHNHDHGHSHSEGHSHVEGACCSHEHGDQSSAFRAPPASPPNLSMRVEGMDCASCVAKIETALARMPGVSDVRVNFTSETLGLTLAPGAATKANDIEKTVKSLGFGVSAVQDSEGTTAMPNPSPVADSPRWWQSRKGKHVVGLGALMAAAYVIANLIPGYGQWIFAAAVVAGVLPFVRKAFALALSGSPFSIEMLMSVAAIGALVIGEAEEAAAVVFLFSVGELLESVAAGRARAGIKALASLVPKIAVLLDPQGGQREVPAASLGVDDRVLIRPGDRVPADGVIVQGMSSLDESPVTGESVPRPKAIGESVFAGSINVDGTLQVQVEKAAADNTISRIIQLVEQAQAAKSPTARFIEQFSRYYTPAIMVIAALIVMVPPLIMGGDWGTWLYRGLALLLIACPCALVLSTPAAIASGLAVGTRRGLLIKGGNALEIIGRARAIAFDKTGTLTEGKPRVTDVVAFREGGEDQVLMLAASVEMGSNHPLAKAIVTHAQAAELVIPDALDASATAGKAVHATVGGQRFAVGSPLHAAQAAALSDAHQSSIETLQQSGKTVSVLFNEQSRQVLGLIALRDEPRRDAREGIARLKAMGIRSIMLTGDNKRTGQAIATALGMECEAELLPQDKLRLINDMKRDGKVAMVGDGINDAPALATADVGIAMGGGTDVAIETADAALLKSRVVDVAHLVALSRATMANIHQNVFFALGLKGLFLVTTVLGVTGLWVAVLADTGATALVTLNALRLLRFKGAAAVDSDGDDGGVAAAPILMPATVGR